MKCPICDVAMAPVLDHPYEIIGFLCSCGQEEHIVTEAQFNEWVLQAYALQFVGQMPINANKLGAEAKVEDSLKAVEAGLSRLRGMH